MSLIVDVNVAHKVLKRDDDPDFGEVARRLGRPRPPIVRIVYGGRLRRELLKDAEVGSRLAKLDRAGRAILVSDERCDELEKQLIAGHCCVSDDPHVIALAQASGVRLLCSDDQDLHADFTNKCLLSNPRGHVYQNRTHDGLLITHCGQDHKG